jgi:hypothetical protein
MFGGNARLSADRQESSNKQGNGFHSPKIRSAKIRSAPLRSHNKLPKFVI